MSREQQITDLYAAFNRRDADALLPAMTADVCWPNGWEGGSLRGRDAVRAYWTRQWAAIDPRVEPVELLPRLDGTVAVRVHQLVREHDGTVLADHEVLHVYRFDGDAIAEMVIEPPVDPARPLEPLARWLAEASGHGLVEHDAVALATADAAGRPSARIVSLRRVEEDALVFTTALWTRKARELEANPHVALVIHWPSLGRQVQIAGRAEPAERALAEALFARRDRPHQLQALVARQGEPIDDLRAMRDRLDAVRSQVGDDPVACPPDWGAVRVRPDAIEYWTAAPDALHVRIALERGDAGWRLTQLAP